MSKMLDMTVLILPRDGAFFAQAIEHAFSAVGRTKDEALDNLCAALQGQAALDREAGRSPLTWMRPARGEYRDLASRVRTDMPPRVLDLFPSGAPVADGERHLRLATVG